MTIDWQGVLQPEHTLEVFIRGSLMYLALFTLIRVVVRRRMGSLAPSDLLVLMLLSDAAQNGMTGDYNSVRTASSCARRSSSGRRRWTGSATARRGSVACSSPSRSRSCTRVDSCTPT